LLGRLALAEDDLRQVVAQGAVVVDLGEADVLIRQVPQFVESGVDAERAGRHGVEEGAELVVYGKRLVVRCNQIIAADLPRPRPAQAGAPGPRTLGQM